MTFQSGTRRHVRAVSPFHGYHLGRRKTPILIFNLNVGGGFVNFPDEPPASATFVLTIDLPDDGRMTAIAEAVYREAAGIAVRFVGLDADTSDRLTRAIDRVKEQPASRV
jgi:hypothetical protein